MYGIIWVVIIVGIAIYQLSMAPGRTVLKGDPFDNEQRVERPRAAPQRRADVGPRQPSPPLTPAPEPIREAAPQPMLDTPPQLVLREEPVVQVTPHDLWQGIILSEILSKPKAHRKAQRTHRR